MSPSRSALIEELARHWLLAGIVGIGILLSFFLGLGAVPLFDLDEGAFSEATREMLLRGDYISTFLNGQPRYDKPILIYWLQAVSVLVFGTTEFAFRLPSALCATAWVVLVFLFVRRVRDTRTGLLAAGFTATAAGITVIGRNRRDGLSGPLGEAGLGGSPGFAAAGLGSEGGFRTDAAPLAPISVPVTALLSGAGGSFRLTDVFGRTPRPAAVAGNGNLRLLYPLIGSSVPTSGFGWRLHPVLGSWLMHAGKDLAAPEGTPVVAALSGRVVSSGLAGGYGLAVEVEHDAPRRRTLYGHLSELYVREGQQVRQGEVIGRVGSTGLSTGPHLHFELRVPQDGGWVAVDPGDLDPGTGLPAGSAIAGLGGLRAPGDGPMPDAVAMLMGQLIQTLERPRSPLAPTPSAQPLPPTQAVPAPAPLPAARQG